MTFYDVEGPILFRVEVSCRLDVTRTHTGELCVLGPKAGSLPLIAEAHSGQAIEYTGGGFHLLAQLCV